MSVKVVPFDRLGMVSY